MRNLIDVPGEHREYSRCGFCILTFIEGIDDYKGRNSGGSEWAKDDFLQLGAKRLSSDLGVGPHNGKQLLSESWEPIGELEGGGWGDFLNIAPILKVSRAEKTRPELPVCKTGLGERLGNGRLPRPRKTVQPEDTLVPLIQQPTFDLPQYILPRPSQASLPVPREVPSTSDVVHPV